MQLWTAKILEVSRSWGRRASDTTEPSRLGDLLSVLPLGLRESFVANEQIGHLIQFAFKSGRGLLTQVPEGSHILR